MAALPCRAPSSRWWPLQADDVTTMTPCSNHSMGVGGVGVTPGVPATTDGRGALVDGQLVEVTRTNWSVACRIVPDHGGRGSRAADAATARVAAAMAAWGAWRVGLGQTGEPRPMHACDGREPATGGESSCHLLATRLVFTVRWRTSAPQKLKATDVFDCWRCSMAAYEVHHHD